MLWNRLLHHRGVNYKSFDEVQVYEPYGPVILASELSPAQMARLAESENDYPGVDFQAQPVRNYPYKGEGSHLFGYVGAITEDEYVALQAPGLLAERRRRKRWSRKTVRSVPARPHRWSGDRSQRVGRARQAARYRRPRAGQYARHDDRLASAAHRREKPGGDAAANGALTAPASRRGGRRDRSKHGGILALASYPEFDPNDFATPISGKKFAHYLNDPLRPLYDRAIGAASPTGSTFKMVTGSGAISSGAIKPNQVLYDSGAWDCHGVRSATSPQAAWERPISFVRSPPRPTATSINSAIVWAITGCATMPCSMD
jgi:penicillin-binding protein 2